MRHVERHVFRGTEFVGVFLVGLELLCTETAGIGAGGIYFIAFSLARYITVYEVSRPPLKATTTFFFFSSMFVMLLGL